MLLLCMTWGLQQVVLKAAAPDIGVWLLHEPIEPSFVVGALLVISGIVLVSGYGWLKQIVCGVMPRN
jgi:drug/metabolite transporter (DMT)-like permease